MNKRLLSKFKFDRRISENIWGSNRSSFINNQNAPGQHGAKSKTVITEYCIRLLAKQKLKFYYSNLTESKLKKAYKQALKYRGNVAHNLIRVLELRLDVLVYRSGLTPSFRAARQLINHGHVLVNNLKVNICSYECKLGDIFRILPKYINLKIIKQNMLSNPRSAPSHVICNYKYLMFKLIGTPKYDGSLYPTPMSPELIIEFYSKE